MAVYLVVHHTFIGEIQTAQLIECVSNNREDLVLAPGQFAPPWCKHPAGAHKLLGRFCVKPITRRLAECNLNVGFMQRNKPVQNAATGFQSRHAPRRCHAVMGGCIQPAHIIVDDIDLPGAGGFDDLPRKQAVGLFAFGTPIIAMGGQSWDRPQTERFEFGMGI